MAHSETLGSWCMRALGFSIVLAALAGCGGNGSTGPQGPQGETGLTGPAAPVTTSTAESLDITIDSVSISSPPVVLLTIKNESGTPVTGLTTSNLRFTIAKLTLTDGGTRTAWQSYINRMKSAVAGSPGEGTSALQGTYESDGTLQYLENGQYRYTFHTDITDPTKVVGGISYEPTLTHRVAIQVSGFTAANPTFDFRPDGGAITVKREIVKIGNCNSCHNKLAMHGGGRIDTKYCVTCHNPGTTDPSTGNTVDFKVMIHKIHRGENLPSVVAGGKYSIQGYSSEEDFSDVVFPQDIRNCTKCHDGSDTATPQGDNWKTKITWQACGSCHDDIDFTKDGSPDGDNDPNGHPGGKLADTLAEIDNNECVTCHAADRIAGAIEDKHVIPEQIARAKFKLNILKICGVAVGTSPGPVCAPGSNPTVTFSITDPTNMDAKYDITTTPEITGSNLSLLVAWDTKDYSNTDNGSSGAPSSANSISISGAVAAADPLTYTVTAGFIVPNGTGPNGYTASGSGAVAFQGRLVADFNDNGTYNETLENGDRERIFPKSQVAFFRITDSTVQARRQVVDNDKCNNCHRQVSLHGGSRNGEVQVCAMCHNPNNTDLKDRPKDAAGGIDVAATVDGKREESVDIKRFIHAIHAGAQTHYDGSEAHGFREKGFTVGDGGHDFSDVRFPGILQDCQTCHKAGTYELKGIWELPTENGILSSTTDAAPTATDTATLTAQRDDPADDLNISPTAAACSSCHDDLLAREHMKTAGGAVFGTTQDVISDTPVVETCEVCHGPGRIADVVEVHAAR